MRKLVRLAAFLVLCPVATRAQGPGTPPAQLQARASGESANYVAGRIGIVLPKAKDLNGFDNGLAVEAVLGRRLTRNIALEASVGYLLVGYYRASGREQSTADVSAVPLSAAVKLIVPLDKVDLFALLGAGVYLFSDEFQTSGVDITGYHSEAATDDGTSLGVTIGAGMTAHLTRRFTLGGEVRYLAGSVELFDDHMRYDSLLVGGTIGWSF